MATISKLIVVTIIALLLSFAAIFTNITFGHSLIYVSSYSAGEYLLIDVPTNSESRISDNLLKDVEIGATYFIQYTLVFNKPVAINNLEKISW